MKVLERHEEGLEEYTIHICEGCGSKLDILKEDCEREAISSFTAKAMLDYICDCPVCGTEIHINELEWNKRPKQKINILKGKELEEFLEKTRHIADFYNPKVKETKQAENTEPKSITFTVSPELIKWTDDHYNTGCRSHATAGEHFQYEFVPTGIVECQTVKCLVCGEKKTVYVD